MDNSADPCDRPSIVPFAFLPNLHPSELPWKRAPKGGNANSAISIPLVPFALLGPFFSCGEASVPKCPTGVRPSTRCRMPWTEVLSLTNHWDDRFNQEALVNFHNLVVLVGAVQCFFWASIHARQGIAWGFVHRPRRSGFLNFLKFYLGSSIIVSMSNILFFLDKIQFSLWQNPLTFSSLIHALLRIMLEQLFLSDEVTTVHVASHRPSVSVSVN